VTKEQQQREVERALRVLAARAAVATRPAASAAAIRASLR
jgi:hypothetical protein